MPRNKAKHQDDISVVTPSNKRKIYALIVVGAVIGIIVAMLAIKKTATEMITHAADRPKAIQVIMKTCTAEMEKSGLKNAEGIAFFNECNKLAIEKLDAKK